MKELNEMTIGRTDDPEKLFGAPASDAAGVFGFGSRIPSGASGHGAASARPDA
jgi:hypothetical protein